MHERAKNVRHKMHYSSLRFTFKENVGTTCSSTDTRGLRERAELAASIKINTGGILGAKIKKNMFPF